MKLEKPTIVCLCGSTRFEREFQEMNELLTRAGKIVLSVGCFRTSGETPEISTEEKFRLDQLHLRKIDLADEVLILNRHGYIGESTRKELAYAKQKKKAVRFLEPCPEEGEELRNV
jgi:hypothetical protein